MTDPEIAITTGVAAMPLFAGFAKLVHWIVMQWAAIRREELEPRAANAAADREAAARRDDRTVAAMDRITATINDHTTRDVDAQTATSKAVVRLEGKVDEALNWRARQGTKEPEQTPSEHSERRRRLRTPPEGSPTR